MSELKYRAGYEYQVAEDYVSVTGLHVPYAVGNKYMVLSPSGVLVVKEGYAWDGPSFPAVHTKNFIRPSLEHDAFYQMMREGLLPPSFREVADRRLQAACLENDMFAIRAWWVHTGVRIGGGGAIEPRPNEILTAP